jgi:hypothetical protein
MYREMLQRHLKETEEHIALNGKHLYEQRALILRLERDGRYDELTAAKELLAQLEDIGWLHLWDRDRLQRALRELGQ